MSKLTLESLAKRVEALEAALAAKEPSRPPKDWRKVIGMFHDSEFMRAVHEPPTAIVIHPGDRLP